MSTPLFAVKLDGAVLETDLSHADAISVSRANPGSRIVPVEIVLADAAAGQLAVNADAVLGGIDDGKLQFTVSPAFVAAADAVKEYDRLPVAQKPAALKAALRRILAVETNRPQTVTYHGKVYLNSLASCLRWAETAAGAELGYEYPDGVTDNPGVGHKRFVVALSGWLTEKPRIPGEQDLNLRLIADYLRNH